MTLTSAPARILTTVAASIAFVVVPPVAGHADAGTSSTSSTAVTQGLSACNSGQFCLWTKPSFQGTVQAVTTVNKAVNISGTHNSVKNDTSHAVKVWSSQNGSGTSRCLVPGGEIDAMGFNPVSVVIQQVTSC